MTIRINASIKDAIERIQFSMDYIKVIPNNTKIQEYDLEETTVEQVKKLLLENETDSCSFSDNCLYITVPLSSKEIAEKIQHRKEIVHSWIRWLVKRSEDEEYKEQISKYLEKYSDKYKDVVRLLQEYDNK